jgi:hypothetical protein
VQRDFEHAGDHLNGAGEALRRREDESGRLQKPLVESALA